MTDLFAEIEGFTKKDIKTTSEALEGIKFLQEKQSQLIALRDEAVTTFNTYNPAQMALENVQSFISDLLQVNGMAALEVAEEFDIPAYNAGWEDVLRNPRSLLLELNGETLKVTNNFNETAGTIEEYADAVQQTRDNLGNLIEPHGVDQAKSWLEVSDANSWHAYFWEEKFYKPAREGDVSSKIDPAYLEGYIQKYWQTIETRARYFKSPAPYWRLIEEGFTAYKRTVNTEAYPSTKPTKFIEQTIEEVTGEFRNVLTGFKENKKGLADGLTKMNKTLVYIEKKIAVLQNIKNIDDFVGFTITKITNELSQNYPTAEISKFEQLALDIAEGKKVQGRVSLGYTPEGKRIRPRTVRLQKQAELFRKGLK